VVGTGERSAIEHRGVQAARQLAQLLQGLPELLDGPARELLGHGVALDPVVQQPELQRDRDEPLLRAVVEVALEPAALLGAGGQQPLP
jgi:hypothetical protein